MRIVSLLPSATETLFALGAGDQVVGVTHECDFPAEARNRPQLTSSLLPHELQIVPGAAPAEDDRSRRIDRHVRADVHAGSSLYALDDALLARLEPDLIVTQELCAVCAVSYEIVAQAAKRLRGDPRIVSLEPSSLEDVYANIATLGELAGVPENARSLVTALRERENALRSHAAARAARPRTLLLEWTDPPMSPGHWTPGLVELAGGEPLLGHAGENSQRIEWSAVTAADPDVIIAVPCGYDLAQARAAIAELAREPAWNALRAVHDGRVYAMDGNAYVNRPGPRLLESAELIAAALAGAPLDAAAIAAVPAAAAR